ncbi:MAG: Rpn family recombination-promoting nuclease/putative transposase [Methyloprofundus sp.]|nr:Rpn family recombination-promoting nuclease/putative transposase [Methyloprofundus sp.]MDT8425787.1 Rpn family recombination-promoting nuclease/putative transposase [Methyloprofundus sp.]
MKFLDVKTDFAFKKVFGSADSKDLLISFLNAVIEFDSKQIITDLTIVDPYNIPMLKGMKDTFVDVKAELSDGSRVIIEMQVLNHEGFEKRVLYNAAKNYSIQLTKGDAYHLLNPVIALTITDFTLFEGSPELISHFKLLEKKQFIEYSDDIELIFIELPKFNKTETELATIQDKWLYFIKNAGDLDYIPHNLEQELEKAFSIANEANLSAEELELQHKKRDWIYIQKSSIELATKTGLKQGLEQGLEQGLHQGVQQGEAALLARLIEKRFGSLSTEVRQQIANADADTLLLWSENIFTAKTLEAIFD